MTILGPNGQPISMKAATGAGVQVMTYEPTVSSLTSYGNSPQKKMARYLAAYRGWFYRAGSVIAADIRQLTPRLVDENEEDYPDEPDLDIPFETLTELGQLQRLLEDPNPRQTWGQLIEQGQLRLDAAGNTMLMLDQLDANLLPAAIYGISPDRMTPAFSRGGLQSGWVMDYQTPNRTPVPFTLDEIIHVHYASPTDDIWGVGVIEGIETDQGIADLITRHTGDVLSSGARLAGMIWPKDGSLEDPEYQDLVRAWRNVANSPNAGKALMVLREPMEWTAGASTPKDIELADLHDRNRDDILAGFPIGMTRLGMQGPTGMNSGETRKYEQEDYQKHTLEPRVDIWQEALQVHLVKRYESVTQTTIQLHLGEPESDDPATLMEKAEAFSILISKGFDEKSAIAAVGLDKVKYNGKPEPVAVPGLPGQPAPGDVTATSTTSIPGGEKTTVVAKGRLTHRASVTTPATAKARTSTARFFTEQRERIVANVSKTYAPNPAARKAKGDWWDGKAEDDKLSKALDPVYKQVAKGALTVVASKVNQTATDAVLAKIAASILERGGTRITGINEATRDAIRETLAEATSRRYSLSQLLDGVKAEGFAGLRELVMTNGAPAWDDSRAETIARTETAIAYNESAVSAWGEYGVTELVANDGDQDEECAERDGQTFSIDEAMDIQDHPNGTLDWEPIAEAEAA